MIEYIKSKEQSKQKVIKACYLTRITLTVKEKHVDHIHF